MDWKVVNTSYRFNAEPEGAIVLKKDPMNWPAKATYAGRPSGILIKDEI